MAGFLTIDEKKALHKNWIFWIAIFLPLVIAFILAAPLRESLSFSFTAEGYSYFLETFQFPIWIASGSILFSIMVGRFHGSAQRAETINQSINQNHFTNYLNHRDHFQKYIFNTVETEDFKLDPFKIYGIIFSNSKPNGVDVTLSADISDFYSANLEEKLRQPLSNIPRPYSTQEVQVYFNKFLVSMGVRDGQGNVTDMRQIRQRIKKLRIAYRRAMEYGVTKEANVERIEAEEHGFALANGEFFEWAQQNELQGPWT
ncbi:MAG: hypothetical protein H7A04_12570 [Pseudomonadales bacterium]|nr:hypothetical protein [Pseudomonadales bacterium]